MRQLQRCFFTLCQRRRKVTIPLSVGPDLTHWGDPRTLARGVPLGKATSHINVTHLGVQGCFSVGLGRNMRVSQNGRCLNAPCDHAYKRIGAPHCVESGPTLCPIVDKSTRNDSHGQQGDSSIHKSPGGRALGTAAGHSETAVMLGAHALALHQSSVHPRCPEQRGRHVEGGSPTRRLDSAPRSDQSDME